MNKFYSGAPVPEAHQWRTMCKNYVLKDYFEIIVSGCWSRSVGQ